MTENIYHLPTMFTKGNRTYSFMNHFKEFIIYEVTTTVDGKGLQYTTLEVFKRKLAKVDGFRKDSDKYKGYDFCEKYPSNEDFGRWAWSTTHKHLDSLLKRLEQYEKV